MKTVLIAAGVLFALYVISQNQTNPPMSTAPVGSPPNTNANQALATTSLAGASTPGVEGAFVLAGPSIFQVLQEEGCAPAAGNCYQLNPVIAQPSRLLPVWANRVHAE